MRKIRKPRPVARRADPGTSWAAARSVRGLPAVQAKIHRILAESGPLTDQEIYEELTKHDRVSESGARTRRRELVDKGLVRESGLYGTTSSGRATIKWEVDDGE